jgi:hypothetical protein
MGMPLMRLPLQIWRKNWLDDVSPARHDGGARKGSAIFFARVLPSPEGGCDSGLLFE